MVWNRGSPSFFCMWISLHFLTNFRIIQHDQNSTNKQECPAASLQTVLVIPARELGKNKFKKSRLERSKIISIWKRHNILRNPLKTIRMNDIHRLQNARSTLKKGNYIYFNNNQKLKLNNVIYKVWNSVE